MPDWDYGGLFRSFAPNLATNTVKARSAAELDKLLSEESFQNATVPQVRIYSRFLSSLSRCRIIPLLTTFSLAVHRHGPR